MQLPYFLLEGFWDIFLNWNIILLILIGCSVLVLAIFIERMMQLGRAEIDTNRFIMAIRKHIREANLVSAIHLCEETGGTIGAIVKAGLLRSHRAQEQVESAMEIAGLLEIAKLEKNAKILSVIAHVAPLIGLLGTVLGFIQAFSQMRLSGLVEISATRIGEAMEYALITTAAGLVVAIPSILAYNYIVSRVEGFVLEIQMASTEIIDLLFEAAADS